MAKFEWSEVFMSIEGEAKYTGHPTAYIRFARCNFKCNMFNNTHKHVADTGYAPLTFNPKQYNDLQSIPMIEFGCDSQYAVNPEFSHMWQVGDENQLAEEVMKVLPHNQWINKSGQNVILSLTGGEPTLRIKFWPELLNTAQFKDVRHILVETNCAVPLKSKHVAQLFDWANDRHAKVTWSNSPKLSRSGESWEEAIKPDVAVNQMFDGNIYYGGTGTFEQYFKFVCAPTEEDFNEVEKAMNVYYAAGIKRDVEVYIMPVACTGSQQDDIAARVADMCIDRGYIFCFRVQNAVYQNAIGK